MDTASVDGVVVNSRIHGKKLQFLDVCSSAALNNLPCVDCEHREVILDARILFPDQIGLSLLQLGVEVAVSSRIRVTGKIKVTKWGTPSLEATQVEVYSSQVTERETGKQETPANTQPVRRYELDQSIDERVAPPPPLCMWYRRHGSCSVENCHMRHEFISREELEAVTRQRELASERRQNEHDPHDLPSENKKLHRERAKIFGQWLIKTFGKDFLSKGSGVVDVAGGKGDLSFFLSVNENVRCTLVDPDDRCNRLNHRKRKEMRKKGSQGFQHIAACFDKELLCSNEYAGIMENASIFVGLHPDEATEAIVDVSVALKKPFAVVPCCVFPKLFPSRRTKNGEPVVNTAQFIQYLMDKRQDVKLDYLPFVGRNKVVYGIADAGFASPKRHPSGQDTKAL